MSNAGYTLLIVEDSPEDYEATERAIARAGVTTPIVRCVDGDDALDWLFGQGRYLGRGPARPALILLDLNLPGTDGREVLTAIKTDPRLAPTPVVILTTSASPRDIAECYRDGANTYIIKPMSLAQLYEALACLVRYWLQIAALPAVDAGRP